MTAVRPGDELRLVGPPSNVRGIVTLDVANAQALAIALDVAGEVSIYRGVVRPVSAGTSEIRVRLPDTIAPAVYSGEATLDGEPRAVIVEIAPQPRLRVQPPQTTLTVEPASSTQFVLTLFNGGNVDIDVPKMTMLDLDDDDGQDRALGRSLRAPLTRGEPRVERFFEELRQVHGGEARVTIRAGAGPLKPGELRVVGCMLDVPESVRAGSSYTGSWAIGPVSHVIIAEVTTSSRPNKVQAAP